MHNPKYENAKPQTDSRLAKRWHTHFGLPLPQIAPVRISILEAQLARFVHDVYYAHERNISERPERFLVLGHACAGARGLPQNHRAHTLPQEGLACC